MHSTMNIARMAQNYRMNNNSIIYALCALHTRLFIFARQVAFAYGARSHYALHMCVLKCRFWHSNTQCAFVQLLDDQPQFLLPIALRNSNQINALRKMV